MTRFQRLLNSIELLKADKKNCSKKWAPYRIKPLEDEIKEASEFAENFMNKDGTICEISLAMMLLEMRNLSQQLDNLETEVRELRYMQEY